MRVVQDRIVEALARARYGLSTEELIAEVWRGAKEPDYAREIVYVTIRRMRKTVKAIDIRFSRSRKRAYQLWFA